MNGTRTSNPSTAISPAGELHKIGHWGREVCTCSCGAAYLEEVNCGIDSYAAWLHHLDRMARGVPEKILTEAEVYGMRKAKGAAG